MVPRLPIHIPKKQRSISRRPDDASSIGAVAANAAFEGMVLVAGTIRTFAFRAGVGIALSDEDAEAIAAELLSDVVQSFTYLSDDSGYIVLPDGSFLAQR